MNETNNFISTYGAEMKKSFHRAVEFQGRSDRAEFWYPFVTVIVASTFIPLLSFIGFLFMIPLGIRRLHDTGRSGWWLAPTFITVPVQLLLIGLWLISLFSLTSSTTSGLLEDNSFLLMTSTSVLGILVIMFKLLFIAYHIVLIYFLCQKGNPYTNQYGPPSGEDCQ